MNPLPKVKLLRLFNRDTGSEGVLLFDSLKLLSLELPWRENLPTFSCIPEGAYLAKWHKSPRFGLCYQLQKVPGRSYILMHSANFAGDTRKGLLSDLLGCITLGKTRGVYKGQRGLFVSKPSVNTFNTLLDRRDFILEISNADSYLRNS